MNNKVFNVLLKLCNKSTKCGDVPVSAVIVKNNKIISKGYNCRIKKYSTINHAEIIAILKANKRLKTSFLRDCDLYVTLKPCEMCQKVINNARINNVYYLLDKPDSKHEYNKTFYKKIDSTISNEYADILGNFFKKLR